MSAEIGVALLGFGYWGANLARVAAASRDARLVGIVDGDATARERAARAFRDVRVVADLAELEADGGIDAALVATPPATHAAVARDLLERGLHVMVEKPLATSVDDAEQLLTIAAAQGRVLMVGHTFLYSAPVRRLRELVDSGDLGKIEYVHAQRLSLGRIRRDCNVLWNLAPHDLSILEHLLGEHPTEVSASGHAFIGPPIEDVYFVTLRYPSGQVANLHLSWIHPQKVRLMTVVGDEQMVVYDDVSVDEKLRIYDSGVARATGQGLGEYESLGDFQWRTRAGDIRTPRIELHEPLAEELRTFFEACAGGPAPITDGEHGLRVVRVLEAIEQSARDHGRPATVSA